MRKIVSQDDTFAGKAFDIFIQIMIVASLVGFSADTLPNLSDEIRGYLYVFEVFTIVIFTAEYIARIVCAEERRKFVFSFFGIIDLLAILPFYLALGFDLRNLRALRLFRLIRILKLVRYNGALQRIKNAFDIAKEELTLFLCAAAIVLYLAGVGIYFFENDAQPEAFSSIFHSLWWAVATLTTVGYGDIYPITMGGKMFTFLILFIGLGVVSIPVGMISSALSQAREMEE